MPRPIDPQLRTIRDHLSRMADLVEEQFTDAVDALLRRDVAMAERVHRRDDEVDVLELEVDHEVERVLALHQPVAHDLRTIITAVKMNNDLERIGDYAKNLAKYTPDLTCADAVACARLGDLADAARGMLREVYAAFEGQDLPEPYRVLDQDDRLDARIDESFEAVVSYGREHPEEYHSVAYLILALKAVERIGDHVKNIAQSVVFLVEGEDIRHQRDGA